MKNFMFSAAFAVSVLCAVSASAITCKVAEVNGVPRLSIDGDPVRARMLYVSPTYFTPVHAPEKRLGKDWLDISFDIGARKKSVDNGVAHFVSERTKKSAYYMSKFEIAEADSGKVVYSMNFDGSLDPRVRFWCKGKNADVKKIPFSISNVKFPDAPNGAMKFETTADNSPLLFGLHSYFTDIKLEAGKAYKGKIRVRGESDNPSTPFNFTLYDKKSGQYESIAPKGMSYVEPQVKLASAAGVDIITFPVQAADFYIEGDMKPDYSNLESAMKSIIGANPSAKILVRIRCYPPLWWMSKNTDHVLTNWDGTRSLQFPSVSSEKYRAETQEVLRKIIDFCEKNFGENVIGYHPGGGNSCEWFYGNSWSPRHTGYDPCTKAAWRKWLSKKYSTDARLRKSWKSPDASIETAEVPSNDERNAVEILVRPDSEAKIADFNEFLQDEMVDMLSSLAKVIRQKVPEKLCVFFYGYAGEFSGMTGGPSMSGHYGLGKLLKNPDIDALCGPMSYDDRQLGGGKSTMGATESIARAGKLWIDEDDTSTYLAPKSGSYPGAESTLDTREKTLKILSRDMAHQAVRNIGSWWMDLGGSGWFNDAELWKLKTAFAPIEDDIIKSGFRFDPEVALVVDERSMYYIGGKGASRRTSHVFGKSRASLNRSGTPFGHYLLDDFLFGKPTNAKLAVFSVACALDSKRRAAVRKFADSHAAIFVWATGYVNLDTKKFSRVAIEEATGFKVRRVDGVPAKVMPTAEGAKIGLKEPFGFDKNFPLLFSPELADGDIVLAVYQNDAPAVVLRGKKLFCGIACVPPELYRYMAKTAGARVYTDSPAAVYFDGKYLSITPTDIKDGCTVEIPVDTGFDGAVFDALTGAKLSDSGKLVLKASRGDSFLLRPAER